MSGDRLGPRLSCVESETGDPEQELPLILGSRMRLSEERKGRGAPASRRTMSRPRVRLSQAVRSA
jgi:hypothetical protein